MKKTTGEIQIDNIKARYKLSLISQRYYLYRKIRIGVFWGVGDKFLRHFRAKLGWNTRKLKA